MTMRVPKPRRGALSVPKILIHGAASVYVAESLRVKEVVVLSFEDFAADRYARMLRLSYVLCGNTRDAEDVTHDAMIRIRRHWSRVSRSTNPSAYANRVLINLFLSNRKRRVVGPVTSLDGDGIEHEVVDPISLLDDVDAVRAAICQLPARQRTAIVLRYYEQLDTDEISDAMGISQSSVRSAVSRGMDQLFRLLRSNEAPGSGRTEERNHGRR